MKKRISSNNRLSPDTFFFTIPFENDQLILTKQVLNKYYEPVPKDRELYRSAFESYISYEKEIIKIAVYLVDVEVKYIYLHMAIDELHVACDCGMPGDKLCAHAFFGLHRLIWPRKEVCLEKLYWPGISAGAISKNKFLDVKLSSHRLLIEPKKQ